MIRTNPESVKSKLPSENGPQAAPAAITLDTPVVQLKAVGSRRLPFFKRLGLATVRDVVYHFPKRHEDRRTFTPIAKLVPGVKNTARGVIVSTSMFRARTGTLILQLAVRDATGVLTGLWFNQPWMKKWFPVGQEVILFGLVQQTGRKMSMMVPEFELITPGQDKVKSLHMGRIVPVYPATSGLHQKDLRNAVAESLIGLGGTLKDPLPESIREKHKLLDFATALKRIHFPPTPEEAVKAQERVTFDELLCFQMALAIRRRNLSERPGIAHQITGDLLARWEAALPFTLTPGQKKAVEQIKTDMGAGTPMRRLLQGEVGSGKTVVAAHAIVIAVQSGSQAVVLAPTEVLARQHALTLSQLLAPVDVQVAMLTSSIDEMVRKRIAMELSAGRIPVIVGTHALLEPWVTFPKLGLVIIDEQQKFGVDQRNTIAAKGNNPDLLILTATPIPRTLSLTLYGEMEISTIVEKPAGRTPVRTLWLDSSRRDQAYAFVRSELEAGRQAYVVCPRIGGDEAATGVQLLMPGAEPPKKPSTRWEGVATASELVKEYQQIFSGYRVALLHGRMTTQEQKEIFTAFKANQIQVLVATQIIEVGVDVANATVMVIEGAERFGLSQLHQLRGRVGRGKHDSTCILMADPKNPAGAERLQKLVDLDDAFQIAEEDLKLRGPGELLGKKQAGVPDLKCLQWATQGPWLEITKVEAEMLVSANTGVSDPEITELRREVFKRFPKITGSACA